MEQSFHVDLRGVVDLLSRHLYSSPRVYLRELLQNAVDAITARGDGPGEIRVTTTDGELEVRDSGIGLTETRGARASRHHRPQSKRDELGFGRHEFLGQFGIGLLSAFLVADEIEVVTRSARGGDAVRWIGFADGHYSVEPAERDEPGTTVRLRPRPGAAALDRLRPTVAELARHVRVAAARTP